MSNDISNELADEVYSLAIAQLAGEATPAEFARLEECLRDPQAREIYLDFIEESAGLYHWNGESAAAELGEQPSDLPVPQSPVLELPTPSRSMQWLQTASRHPMWPSIGVAVVVLMGVLLAAAVTPLGQQFVGSGGANEAEPPHEDAKPDFVAKLNHGHNAVWLEDTRAAAGKERLEVGRRLVLESGLIEIEYDTGAVVLVEGPAEYEVQSANGGQLKLGKLTAKVGGANGFELRAGELDVVDLGTEFGAVVDRRGTSEVFVYNGRITVENLESEEAVRELSAGQSVRHELGSPMRFGTNNGSDLVRHLPQPAGPPPIRPMAEGPSIEILSDAGDGEIRDNGTIITGRKSVGIRIGGAAPQTIRSGIFLFKLPQQIPAADDIAGASLRLHLTENHNTERSRARSANDAHWDVDLYGLGWQRGTTLQASWHFANDNDRRTGNALGTNLGERSVTKIHDNLITGATSVGKIDTNEYSNTLLMTFLKSLYSNGARPGDFVILRVNGDCKQPTGRYMIALREAADADPALGAPTLTIIIKEKTQHQHTKRSSPTTLDTKDEQEAR